jgi:hypothetical protein
LKYRALALLPLMLAALMATVALLLGPQMPVALTVANEAGKMLALGGAVSAALAFEQGEYLNRAWLTYGGCYALLLVNDSLGAFGPTGEHMLLVRGLVVVAANTSSVVGTWMLARAWTVAGLDDEDTGRARRRTMFAGAVLLSLAVTGWPLLHDVRALIGGDPGALISIASDLGDTFTLSLVAPVMHTALAMRGGLLRWPWGMVTLSGLAWIVYDATSSVIDLPRWGPCAALVASEAFRVLANGWVFSAGVAQRLAVAPDERVSQIPPEWL